MLSLINAPLDKPLKIVQFLGGHGMKRKLMSLGIHIGDVIEVDSRSLFGGPILIKSLTNNTIVALGRGIARKIMVAVIND